MSEGETLVKIIRVLRSVGFVKNKTDYEASLLGDYPEGVISAAVEEAFNLPVFASPKETATFFDSQDKKTRQEIRAVITRFTVHRTRKVIESVRAFDTEIEKVSVEEFNLLFPRK